MHIAVIGAGAIGSIVAAFLQKAGIDVALVCRPQQLEILTQRGLTISGINGREVFKVKVIPHLDKEYDVAIFAVKTQDLEEAYQKNHEYLDRKLILTTQNGVQADNVLSAHFEKEQMMSSIVMFGATYTGAGEVTYNFPGDWILGRPFMPNDGVLQETAAVLRRAFSVVISSDIIGMKWLKLFVNFNNCLPALIGQSMQQTFSDMDFCKLSVLLLKEGFEVVQKAGISLSSLPQFPLERVTGLVAMPIDQAAAIMHKTLTSLSKEPLYGSILQSILRKRTSEIDFINGEVLGLAKNIQMKTPLNRRVVDLVHAVEERGRFFSPEEIKKEFQLN